MQTRSREQADGDLYDSFPTFSEFKTDEFQHEVICADCGNVYYTDDEFNAKFRRSLELSADNPFVCDDCRSEYEELAADAR